MGFIQLSFVNAKTSEASSDCGIDDNVGPVHDLLGIIAAAIKKQDCC